MKKINNVIWGIVLVAVGVIFGLNAVGITDINLFFDGWWTLIIIIPCLCGLFTSKDKTGNLIGLAIGVFLLVGQYVDRIWDLIVPAVIVLIGLSLIFRSSVDKAVNKTIRQIKEAKANNANKKEYCATFSGQNISFSGETFDGAELTAVFGGIKCDLRGAVIREDAVLEVCAVFGGVDVILPDDVNVKLTSNGSVFGGVSDKGKRSYAEGRPTVYISATCIFGGADIK